jgi:hypothetical protein
MRVEGVVAEFPGKVVDRAVVAVAADRAVVLDFGRRMENAQIEMAIDINCQLIPI